MVIENHKVKSSCKIVTIKTYPHLKKFMKKFYPQNSDGSTRIDDHRMAGVLLGITLDKKHKVSQKYTDRMTDEIRLSLNRRISRKSLTNAVLLQYNVEFDKLFKDQLCLWIIAQSKLGVTASESIANFREEYKIYEGDYSTENMYRAWTRFKNDEYHRLKSA
jgi:hypothetical protein